MLRGRRRARGDETSVSMQDRTSMHSSKRQAADCGQHYTGLCSKLLEEACNALGVNWCRAGLEQIGLGESDAAIVHTSSCFCFV